ncbi:alpha/beta fold hydrolase [Pseudomonas sp. EL_65y_Pfl2_R95]|uniref:alpha/beta fold hydrolase n=1 Tax=Pseudomonas sp. EL_65y_Pfl2_R95 TaxID=3088698 RepID=UPI0030D81225
MQLFPWSHANSAGFTSGGWHSKPSAKPVLHFLHGNGYCGRVYEPMLEALAEHFDLWLCDAQGHGESDHGGRFHGWNRNAELAVEAWSTVGRECFADAPLYAVGHSFGGVLTSLILAQHPQLFKRAVLLDPVLFSAPMIGVMALSDVVGLSRRTGMAAKAVKRRKVWPDRATAQTLLQGRGMFRGWTEDAFSAYIEHALKDTDAGVELKCRPSREADIFSSYPRRLWSSLAKIQTPTEIIYGQRSYPFVAKSVARCCASNSQIQGQVVEGGHCFMQEHPQASAERVSRFLLAQHA